MYSTNSDKRALSDCSMKHKHANGACAAGDIYRCCATFLSAKDEDYQQRSNSNGSPGKEGLGQVRELHAENQIATFCFSDLYLGC